MSSQRVPLTTRVRIFVVSTGFVAACFGATALYVAFFHDGTAARVGTLETVTGQQAETLATHDSRIETHGRRLDAAESTLVGHGARLAAAEAGVAQSEATANRALAEAERLEKALAESKSQTDAQVGSLRDDVESLRAKLKTLETDQQAALGAILDRLAALEQAQANGKP